MVKIPNYDTWYSKEQMAVVLDKIHPMEGDIGPSSEYGPIRIQCGQFKNSSPKQSPILLVDIGID